MCFYLITVIKELRELIEYGVVETLSNNLEKKYIFN